MVTILKIYRIGQYSLLSSIEYCINVKALLIPRRILQQLFGELPCNTALVLKILLGRRKRHIDKFCSTLLHTAHNGLCKHIENYLVYLKILPSLYGSLVTLQPLDRIQVYEEISCNGLPQYDVSVHPTHTHTHTQTNTDMW